MSLAKLNDADKQELVDLYRQTPATTTTLAERFGVSVSTVSRLLKNEIAAPEYENLVIEKRGSRFSKGNSQLILPLANAEKSKSGEQQNQEISPINAPNPPAHLVADLCDTPKVVDEAENDRNSRDNPSGKRRRTRSRKTVASAPIKPEIAESKEINEVKKLAIASPMTIGDSVELPDDLIEEMQGWETEVEPVPVNTPRPQIVSIKSSALDEIVKDIDEDLDLLDEEDLDDLEDDEDGEDDEDEDEDGEDYPEEPAIAIATDKISANGFISILPFAGVTMPKNCYLVVDNKADLIVRPLNEFSLGSTIPSSELKEKTLPIFENHRVARRFSLRTQKVIKIPNGEIIQKTAQALKAKGITRVFIHGKVYAL